MPKMMIWAIFMALAPVALFGMWQVMGHGRFRGFLLRGLLVLHALLALALWRGFGDVLVWTALLLALLWLMVMVTVPLAIVGALQRRWRWGNALRTCAALGFASLLGFSLYSAYSPTIRHVQITLDKPLDAPVRILLASDVHLYWLFGNRQLNWLSQTIQREKVDLVLMPGDIINDHLHAFHKLGMAPHLAAVKAPLGVYATLGNHDFYGSAQANAQALRDAGITVLRDEVVEIGAHEGPRLLVAGRDDDMNRRRPSTAALLASVNKELPVLLLDHRPTQIQANAKAGVDLQVSGHVHNGQIFPMMFLVKRMYPVPYGHLKINGMDAVVTSGYGFWGVPLRLGTRSEVWLIDLQGRPRQ